MVPPQDKARRQQCTAFCQHRICSPRKPLASWQAGCRPWPTVVTTTSPPWPLGSSCPSLPAKLSWLCGGCLVSLMLRVRTENWISCHARSADTCVLREFYLLFHPATTNLGHFHSRRQPPERSRRQRSLCFQHAPATRRELTFPHLQHDGASCREPDSFTHATERKLLPESPAIGSWVAVLEDLEQVFPAWYKAVCRIAGATAAGSGGELVPVAGDRLPADRERLSWTECALFAQRALRPTSTLFCTIPKIPGAL